MKYYQSILLGALWIVECRYTYGEMSLGDEIDKPSQYDPGTMVYKLVQELTRYLEEK